MVGTNWKTSSPAPSGNCVQLTWPSQSSSPAVRPSPAEKDSVQDARSNQCIDVHLPIAQPTHVPPVEITRRELLKPRHESRRQRPESGQSRPIRGVWPGNASLAHKYRGTGHPREREQRLIPRSTVSFRSTRSQVSDLIEVAIEYGRTLGNSGKIAARCVLPPSGDTQWSSAWGSFQRLEKKGVGIDLSRICGPPIVRRQQTDWHGTDVHRPAMLSDRRPVYVR
jgi:hypothetical protein